MAEAKIEIDGVCVCRPVGTRKREQCPDFRCECERSVRQVRIIKWLYAKLISGEEQGPFTLDGASAIKYFETDFTASKLRFAPSDSSGGNTGAVEIEIYGDPAP